MVHFCRSQSGSIFRNYSRKCFVQGRKALRMARRHFALQSYLSEEQRHWNRSSDEGTNGQVPINNEKYQV